MKVAFYLLTPSHVECSGLLKEERGDWLGYREVKTVVVIYEQCIGIIGYRQNRWIVMEREEGTGLLAAVLHRPGAALPYVGLSDLGDDGARLLQSLNHIGYPQSGNYSQPDANTHLKHLGGVLPLPRHGVALAQQLVQVGSVVQLPDQLTLQVVLKPDGHIRIRQRRR